jgi:hypothetical protein
MGYYEGMWGLEGLVNDKLFWKGQRAELLAENDRLEELNEKMLKWWKEMSVLRFMSDISLARSISELRAYSRA